MSADENTERVFVPFWIRLVSVVLGVVSIGTVATLVFGSGDMRLQWYGIYVLTVVGVTFLLTAVPNRHRAELTVRVLGIKMIGGLTAGLCLVLVLDWRLGPMERDFEVLPIPSVDADGQTVDFGTIHFDYDYDGGGVTFGEIDHQSERFPEWLVVGFKDSSRELGIVKGAYILDGGTEGRKLVEFTLEVGRNGQIQFID